MATSFLQSRFLLHTFSRHLCSNTSLKVGRKAELFRVFSASDVCQFADLTGDTNPLHLDEKYARTSTQFGRCVVHGALVNGLISALHGTILPGPGCIVVSQQLKFMSPLYVDEEVRAEVEILSHRHHIMKCSARCTATERNEVILVGETRLVIPKM
ncbi:hydroxyacyl-thioester dehydratase type 2, mitochondrial [Nematostella vectensis]|uniref:hydroxyacyl-thioester dehydratase type 2, mitochondrial n=1 Tax=Nematostella vectensis TaxID=45351 RepID=UPI0013904246|nr:hydroxyacyl-thioester dehydratase type 2, mitochondrial [Nematostella vectensis]